MSGVFCDQDVTSMAKAFKFNPDLTYGVEERLRRAGMRPLPARNAPTAARRFAARWQVLIGAAVVALAVVGLIYALRRGPPVAGAPGVAWTEWTPDE